VRWSHNVVPDESSENAHFSEFDTSVFDNAPPNEFDTSVFDNEFDTSVFDNEFDTSVFDTLGVVNVLDGIQTTPGWNDLLIAVSA
jgi:hypothetical protein